MQTSKKLNLTSFADLIKYKLSAAVTFSGVTGYYISNPQPGFDFLFLITGLFLTAGGSAALNQFTENRYDSLMQRTKNRPIPSNKVEKKQALIIAFLLISAGLALLSADGLLPFSLGLINIFIYNILYTKLKRLTPLALIPGSLVGAIPPLIGYFASGKTVPDHGVLLFSLFMFLWQIPHFWLIGVKYADDYRAAGFKFYSFHNVQRPRVLIFSWILFTTLFLIVFAITEIIFHKTLIFFLIPVNLLFILLFYSFLFKTKYEQNIKPAFILINVFSIIVMFLFIINSFISEI